MGNNNTCDDYMVDWTNNNKSRKGEYSDNDVVTAVTYKTNQSCTLQKLEETLAEYDSDEIGSLEQECDDIQGFRNSEEDQLVNTTLTEYLQQSNDDDFYIRTTNQQQDKKEEEKEKS